MLSDASGQKVTGSEVVYAPFGEVRAGELSALTDFGYTGQRVDRSTGGLMYYGARYYLPGLRRFISADTIVPGAANPQAFNRYAYTLNNPIRFTDPTGHRIADDPYHKAKDQSKVHQPTNPEYGKPDPTLEAPSGTGGSGGGSGDDNSGGNSGGTNSPYPNSSPTEDGPNSDSSSPPELVDESGTGHEDPNPPLLALIPMAIGIHLLTGATDLAIVYAEILLLTGNVACVGTGLAIAACEAGIVTLELSLAVVGLALIDFDLAFMAYTYNVAEANGQYEVQLNLDPRDAWGLNDYPPATSGDDR